MKNHGLICSLIFLLFVSVSSAATRRQIVVAHDGSGDFTSISSAIDSLGMYNYQRIEILVKNGVYEEKISVTQDYVTIRGESRDQTIMRMDLPRSLYLENEDSIGPAIINVYGDDFILENITVENTHPVKRVHAFAIYGKGTRTVIQDCNVWSNGGDTVSLWNYKTGMYYHARCDFRGGVDFVCPRGWCYIEDSSFFTTYDTAALWHAGPFSKDQKFVLRNCSFDGAETFKLGRHHYEAQFFLLDCEFSEKVSDKPIYRVTYEDSSRNRPFVWGERYNFYGASGDGSTKSWMQDNLNMSPESITPEWTFGGQWDPVRQGGPLLLGIRQIEGDVIFDFDETVAVYGNPVLRRADGLELVYEDGAGSSSLRFKGTLKNGDLNEFQIIEGEVIGNRARAVQVVWKP